MPGLRRWPRETRTGAGKKDERTRRVGPGLDVAVALAYERARRGGRNRRKRRQGGKHLRLPVNGEEKERATAQDQRDAEHRPGTPAGWHRFCHEM